MKNNSTPDKTIPKGVKLNKNQLWCPYCSNPVTFIKDKELGVYKCPFCGISERDYNVKKINKLWGKRK